MADKSVAYLGSTSVPEFVVYFHKLKLKKYTISVFPYRKFFSSGE